jgi:hypothetical protein
MSNKLDEVEYVKFKRDAIESALPQAEVLNHNLGELEY